MNTRLTDQEIVELRDHVMINEMMNKLYYDLTQYHKQRDHLDDLFMEEAVMIVNGFEMDGREAIRTAYSTRKNENVGPGMTLNMLVGNPRIKVDGNKATVDLVWTGILNENLEAPPRLLQQGTDHTKLVKVDGKWKIKYRVITSLSNMPDAWNGS